MSLLLVGPGDLCGAEVDGWINSRAGQRWSTDRGLTAAFDPPLTIAVQAP